MKFNRSTVNKIVYILYIVLGVCAVALASIGISWAVKGKVSTEITEICAATVTVDNDDVHTRREYVMGEEVKLDGVAITVTTKEGKTVTPALSECKIEADMDTAGKKPVVVSYQEGAILYRGSYEITVYAVKHLQVQPMTEASKLVYAKDETELSKEGIIVWAHLAGEPQTDEFMKPNPSWADTIQLTPEQFTVSSNEMGQSGVHWAVVQCGQSNVGYQFAVEGAFINTASAAQDYGVGETFVPAGVEITNTSLAFRSADNLLGTRYESNFTCSDVDTSTAGTKAVTITYGSQTAEYTVNVYHQAFSVSDIISLKDSEADGTECTLNFYWSKGTLTTNEGRFKMTYKDGNFIRHQSNTWGWYGDNITMWTYNGVVNTCAIYYDGNFCRWDATGNDNHGSTPSNGTDFDIFYPYASYQEGGDTKYKECYAKGKLASLEATKKGMDAKSITVQAGEKTAFEKGEKFVSDGVIVTAQLWNGGERTLDSSEYLISAPDMKSVGSKSVAVSYGSLKDDYSITVCGYKLSAVDGKTVYGVGETLSLDNLKVERYDENGVQAVESSAFALVGEVTLDKAGTKKVTVKTTVNGEEQTYSYTVAVIPAESDRVSESSVLHFTNRNGSETLTLYLTDRDSINDSVASTAAGWYALRASDGNASASSFAYNYNPVGWASDFSSNNSNLTASVLNDTTSADDGALFVKVDGLEFVADQAAWHDVVLHWVKVAEYLELDYSQATREYLVGGTFDSSKLVVKLKYSDGSRDTITDYQITAPDMSTIGVKTITVSYDTFTASYQIFTIPDVPWETHKLDFANASGTWDRLEAYVTDRTTQTGYNASAKGWYLLKKADGNYEMYEFTYNLQPDNVSVFTCDGVQNTVDDSENGKGRLVAQINGLTFTADATTWHNRIIGWQ